MNATLKVDSTIVSLSAFVIPEMNLSSSKSEMNHHNFTIEFLKSDLVELLDQAYSDWVKESKEDEELYDEPQDELSYAGYPPLLQIVNSKELSELVFGWYLYDTIFEKVLPKFDQGKALYWYDKVNGCSLTEDSIILQGDCYSKK